MVDEPIGLMRTWWSRRCSHLFFALVLLLVLLPVFNRSPEGERAFAGASLLVLVASLVALGESRRSFRVALLLGGPALVLLALAHATGNAEYRAWSWRFSVAVFVATLVHLLRYVLRPGPMTVDKLFGGAAAYLLLGLLWCYLYALTEHRSPGSLAGLDTDGTLHVARMVFFSFGTLTTGGLAELVPRGRIVHTLVILEQLAGTLYMAVIVARLVSSYPRPGPPD